jgi:hypothetical protein
MNPRKRALTPLVTLSADIGPLREAFNRDVDKVRLLLLVSPT